MKMRIYNLVVLIVLTVVLASCLGDGKTDRRANNEFAYIQTIDGKKYATTLYGYIHHSNLDRLDDGDCLFVNFGFTADNMTNITVDGRKENVFNADFMEFDIEKDYYPRLLQIFPKVGSVDLGELATSDSVFNNIIIPDKFYYTGDYFGNKWLASFSYKLRDNETKPRIEIYYDKENQKDPNGTVVETDERIIDIRMRRYGGGITTIDPKNEKDYNIINFDELKKEFENGNKSKDGLVYLRFRYYKFKTSTVTPNEKPYGINLTQRDKSLYFSY